MLSLSLAEIYALDSVSRADLGACIAAHALGVVDFGEIVLDLNCASWAGILALLAAYAGSLARLYGYRALVLAAVFASAGTSLITKLGHAFVHIPQPVHFAGSTQATPLLL